ncbi:MAG: bifunctional phosphopantothenoylcysteine decarboxylase/phosphopantothenate--cysteine ligase CoaBC [Fimbriimonadaceae bacterium]|nr:bifunctional phosphopantothenoylcysteine decarboxylase/phosphopantothenate--cysteine ligase CoaBC [Fimbriimonadaceae bacterium]
MAKVILGVTGSVACYRAADLAREMMREGHEVRVLLTRSAAKFVTSALFEALTGQPCLVDAFEEPERGRMAHIDWARWADLVLVAPATAHAVNALAQGRGEDMLTTLALAAECPLIVAPAMNPSMWSHETTRESMTALQSRAAWVVEPGEGEVACGEEGQGKLASIPEILAAVRTVLGVRRLWQGRRVLLTSGPTEEPWDDVRRLTNRSSGRMGSALARAALWMGAEVTVIAGPQRAPLPAQARVVRVTTAQEMLEAGLSLVPEADVVFGVAAVADYRPAERVEGKIRRSGEELNLRLVPNPDVIAALRQAAPHAKVVAFAAEPDDGLEAARQKMIRKGVDALAVNNVGDSTIGFESASNRLTLLLPDADPMDSGFASKAACSVWMLERLAEAWFSAGSD